MKHVVRYLDKPEFALCSIRYGVLKRALYDVQTLSKSIRGCNDHLSYGLRFFNKDYLFQ